MTTIRDGLSYDDVWLVPKRSPVTDLSAVETTANVTDDLILDVPILGAAMDTVTEAAMATALSQEGGLGVIHRFLSIDEQAAEVQQVAQQDEQVAAAIGVNEAFVERADALLDAGVDCLVLDVAHGHMDQTLDTLQELRSVFGDVNLVAGNVATAAAVEDLASAGADCVKVGVGPGSHCTTRKVAGAGVPQFTAVMECAEAADAHGIYTIADGGIRTSGEIVKALMAGADTVMLGGLLMGADEAPGDIVEVDGEQYKQTRGMASAEARQERTDKDGDGDYAAEGIEGLTPYKGSVKPIIRELVAGMRSGISYCGAATLNDARRNAEFVKTSGGAKTRAGAHGHGILER